MISSNATHLSDGQVFEKGFMSEVGSPFTADIGSPMAGTKKRKPRFVGFRRVRPYQKEPRFLMVKHPGETIPKKVYVPKLVETPASAILPQTTPFQAPPGIKWRIGKPVKVQPMPRKIGYRYGAGFRPVAAGKFVRRQAEEFVPVDAFKFPRTYPQNLRPSIEPYPSAEGLNLGYMGQDEAWYQKAFRVLKEKGPEAYSKFMQAKKMLKGEGDKEPAVVAPVTRMTQEDKEEKPKGMSMTTLLLIAGGGAVAVGLLAYFLARK